MKKLFKTSIALLLCISFMLTLCVSAFASTVSYDDVTEKFVFKSDSKENPTDLFENFKDAMPGDKLTQEIVLTNVEKNRMSVKFFLKSKGADKASEELLSKLTLSIKVDGEKTPFFNAPANEASSLADWVELGTLHQGGTVKLIATLQIPTDIDDKFYGAKGEIDWVFKSEEQPIDTAHEDRCPYCNGEWTRKLVKGEDGKYYYYYECLNSHTTPPVPVNGENFNIYLWGGLAVLSGLTVAGIVIAKKRKKISE